MRYSNGYRVGYGRYGTIGRPLARREQAALWRAAARGAEANGNVVEALRCWNTARLILGLPPRKTSSVSKHT